MTTPFAAATVNAHRSMLAIAGVAVTFAGSSVNVVAVRTTYEEQDQFGSIYVHEGRQYVAEVDKLPRLPQQGDTITEGSNSYEVLPYGANNYFVYSGADRKLIRIMAKRV